MSEKGLKIIKQLEEQVIDPYMRAELNSMGYGVRTSGTDYTTYFSIHITSNNTNLETLIAFDEYTSFAALEGSLLDGYLNLNKGTKTKGINDSWDDVVDYANSRKNLYMGERWIKYLTFKNIIIPEKRNSF